MSNPVSLERHGTVALITIDNPPVNAIDHAVRSALLQAVIEADDDASVQAIVLHGAGRNFIAGADIREMAPPGPKEPLLNDVLLRVESCRKPVVAALHGAVLGGGLEVALASHYRCATDDVQLGFPEIKLGLLPGSGGTQRLPRLIGVQPALDMMISGEAVGVARARSLGLLDGMLAGADVVKSAIDYARGLIASKALPRRVRDRSIPQVENADDEFFTAYRKGLSRSARQFEVAERIIQCVEAAVSLPFTSALARSRELFEESRLSTQSAALRHLFLAERGARGADAEKAASVRNIAVIGAGTMGSGIAMACATSGFDVTLIDVDGASLDAGFTRAMAAIDGSVAKGKLSAEVAELARSRLRKGRELRDAAEADFVIEAVFESMSVKQDVFRQLDAVCKPHAVLASNTSTLDVDEIASATSRPQNVIGMHFFSPAHIMRLVEIVRGRVTSPETIATTQSVTKRLGKVGVVVGNCFGFVGNRMLYAYGRENQFMQLEGAAPDRIDRVLEEWGMALGPNAVGDLAGLDVGYRARKEQKNPPTDPRYWRVSSILVEMGRLGQKSGQGFYRYEGEKRERKVDPQLVEIIRVEAQRLSVPQRTITDQEIVERCIYALVNEGARILEEGIASSSDDIDVIWANGYGFPRTRGGPMFYADTVGLPNVLETIRKYEREQGELYWAPAPLLVDLESTRDSFGALCASGA
jgi:3-hydroxyacyl-CoA dehydrogenase